MTPDLLSVPSLDSVAIVAGFGGVVIALRGLVALFPRLRIVDVLMRVRALAYVGISAAFAVGAVCLFRYLDEPATRLTAVEQVVFALIGTGVAVRPPRSGKAADSGNNSAASDAVGKAAVLVNGLLRALEREIRLQVNEKQAKLVGQASYVEYGRALPLFWEHLGHAGVNASDSEAEAERKALLNQQASRIDALALEDEDTARDALLYLVLDVGGEQYLATLLEMYDWRYQLDRPRPPWYRPIQRIDYGRWQRASKLRQSVPAAPPAGQPAD